MLFLSNKFFHSFLLQNIKFMLKKRKQFDVIFTPSSLTEL